MELETVEDFQKLPIGSIIESIVESAPTWFLQKIDYDEWQLIEVIEPSYNGINEMVGNTAFTDYTMSERKRLVTVYVYHGSVNEGEA